jgi:zinc transport system substrate-binding protein
MKKFRVVVAGVLFLVFGVSLLLGGCTTAGTGRLKVVTTTSMMAQIVEAVGGDAVEVAYILPPTQCPGHYDVKPGDIQHVADADLFLLHGWQGEMFAQELVSSADNYNLVVVSIQVKGIFMTPPPQLEEDETLTGDYWMMPPVQLEAVGMVADALCRVDARNSAAYETAAAEYGDVIEARGEEIRLQLEQANVSGVKVICAGMLTGFIEWVGLDIAATYGRPDSFTPQLVRELVDTGREEGVTLIIDNLQSGQDAGAGIAEELGCQRIILSNFPGGLDDTGTWEKAIDENVERILAAIGQ